jgi:hypothetical protein
MQTIAARPAYCPAYVSAVLLAVTDDYLLELTYLEYVRYVSLDYIQRDTDEPELPTALLAANYYANYCSVDRREC